VSTRFLTVLCLTRDETIGAPRLGLAVPKEVGNAVVRNRIKRQLRELFGQRVERLPRWQFSQESVTCLLLSTELPSKIVSPRFHSFPTRPARL